MAEEERGGIQNVWLLFIALSLGVLVVVIYNVHIYKVRQEGRGKTIRLLKVTHDMERGEKIAADDLETVTVPRQHEESIGDVVDDDMREYAIGQALNQPVEKGRWLLWEHITSGGGRRSSNEITPGCVAVAVPLDSKLAPGDILRLNDRVNIVGLLPMGQSLKTFRMIEGVRVVAIGGEGIQPAKVVDVPAKRGRSARSYQSITIEVSKDVALEFANVLTHVSGSCWVELLSSRESDSKNFGRINPQLKGLAAQPSSPPAGSEGSREKEWE
jgi:Flp pilus assembly protein CpaB